METIGNINIYNSTPHSIRFQHEGKIIEVESDFVINADISERTVFFSEKGIEYVKPIFLGNKEGYDIIEKTHSNDENAVIIGSLIAAQAYPGLVFAMVPCNGFERVPPAEKRMRANKFTSYAIYNLT